MAVLQKIQAGLWAWPTVTALILSGVWLSWNTGFIQIRKFRTAMRSSLARMLRKNEKGTGTSAFEAVCTALAGTVGTGNIAGVAIALTMGGPGALLWMWVSMAVGMGIKYCEIALAVRFREKQNGEYVGGPMFTIKNGLGERFLPLAAAFSVFGAAAALGVGNMTQMSGIVSLEAVSSPKVLPLVAVGMAAGVAATCRGGAEGRGRTAALLVPFMAGLYVLGALAVVAAHLDALPGVMAQIVRGALGWGPAVGGTVGAGFTRAMSWGIRRGIFSNEAGLGSSSIAHASARADDPGEYALMGIFEVFVDTGVICTLTGLMLLTSGVTLSRGVPGGAADCAAALATVFGRYAANAFMGVSMALFAFSSIVGWSLYGERCVQFLLGEGGARLYRLLFPFVTFLSAFVSLPAVIAVSDIMNALMMAPNVASLLLLTPQLRLLSGRDAPSASRRCPSPPAQAPRPRQWRGTSPPRPSRRRGAFAPARAWTGRAPRPHTPRRSARQAPETKPPPPPEP